MPGEHSVQRRRSCAVNVAFAPLAPGMRAVAVTLFARASPCHCGLPTCAVSYALPMLRLRHSGQPISFSAYTFSCLQSPVFQSLRSASLNTCAVCRLQHSSVLSMKRTRTYSIPSSKTCSAQSTILPWTPGYCFPGPKSPSGLSAAVG
jgi:hypothetical protein